MIAVAGLADLLIGLLCLLLLAAAVYFVRSIAQAIPTGIPYVGSWLRNTIIAGADYALAALGAYYDSTVSTWENMILSPIRVVTGIWDHLIAVATQAYDTLYGISRVIIPTLGDTLELIIDTEIASVRAEIGTVESELAAYSVALYNQAIANIDHDITVVESIISGDVAALESTISGDVAALVNYTNEALGEAETFATTLGVRLEQYTDAAFSSLAAYAQAGLQTVLGDAATYYRDALSYADTAATTAAANAIGALTTDVDNIVAAGWIDLRDDVNEVIGILGTDIPDLLVDIESIPISAPISIAGAIGLSIPLARTVATYLRECGVPNCTNLSQFGKDIQALFSLVEDAGFLALIVEMAHNPQQAARDVEDVFTPIVSGALASARDLIGV